MLLNIGDIILEITITDIILIAVFLFIGMIAIISNKARSMIFIPLGYAHTFDGNPRKVKLFMVITFSLFVLGFLYLLHSLKLILIYLSIVYYAISLLGGLVLGTILTINSEMNQEDKMFKSDYAEFIKSQQKED